MVKVCNDYYMIDALAGGEVIRKRKYRRENTMIGYKWYDYNGVEVTDPIEISRLDGLATKHQRVDEAYDDHAIFMSSTNYVNSVSMNNRHNHTTFVNGTQHVQWMVVRIIVHKVRRISQQELKNTHCYNETADDYDTGILYTYNLRLFSSFHNKFFC